MEEVLFIKIDELHPHPNQTAIYGEEEPEAEFLESVRERGVMTPLIITPAKKGYIIVSGHRRKTASKLAGKDAVPCIIRRYKTQEELDIAHIELNRQREKTTKQKINEFITWKQILRQDLQLIDNKVDGIDEKTANMLSLRRLNEIDIKSKNKGKRIVDIIEESTGLSEWFQRNATVVFDDIYSGDKIEKYRDKGVSEKVINKIWQNIQEVRKSVKKGDLELSEAAKGIKEMFKKIEEGLSPKKTKVRKAKTENVASKETELYSISPITRYTFSQKPVKYEESKSVIDFVIKTAKGNDAGIIKTMGQPTGFCIHIKGREGVFMINLDELATMVEKKL